MTEAILPSSLKAGIHAIVKGLDILLLQPLEDVALELLELLP
jgi:hypothetical protein